MIQCRIQLLWLAVFALSMLGAERYSHAKKKKPVFSFLSKLKKRNQSLKRKLLQHKLMLVELYRINQAQVKRIRVLEAKQKPLIAIVERLKKANQTSCLQILNLFPNTKSGLYTIYRKGKAIKAYCDMKTAGGGWTRFMHHSDPNGRIPIKRTVWDKGIQFAADGGIKEWMVKTFTNPHHNSEKNSKFTNAWTMTLATKVQGSKFVFFRYRKPERCGVYRYQGNSFLMGASLISGSQCTPSIGRSLHGEHKWCGGSDVGWFWMPLCNAKRHLLIVNHRHRKGARPRTVIGINGNEYSDGGRFEFFYR